VNFSDNIQLPGFRGIHMFVVEFAVATPGHEFVGSLLTIYIYLKSLTVLEYKDRLKIKFCLTTKTLTI
jgi:hypothetical protein